MSRLCRNDRLSPAVPLRGWALLVAAAGVASMWTSKSLASDPPPSTGSDDLIVIVGAAGEAEYGSLFEQWAAEWDAVADQAAAGLQSVGRDDADDQTDRQRLQALINSADVETDHRLWIVMLGHGTFTRGVAKFNLRGPDITATELAAWLEPLRRPVVVIDASSSSGPFLKALTGRGRVVVTSTKSGTEQNFARFGGHFVRAIASADADLDHDDEVSVLEAFLRASDAVRRFYESESRIATEHALIEDNGDGKGTPATLFRSTRPVGQASDGSALDGAVARWITLAPVARRLPLTDAEAGERESIEAELEAIRTERQELSDDAYDARVEPLLVRLAQIYRQAEARDDGPPLP